MLTIIAGLLILSCPMLFIVLPLLMIALAVFSLPFMALGMTAEGALGIGAIALVLFLVWSLWGDKT